MYLFYLEEEKSSNSNGLAIGLSLGLGIPALVVIIWILYKTKTFKKLKQSWNDFVSSIRHRLNNCFHPQPQSE